MTVRDVPRAFHHRCSMFSWFLCLVLPAPFQDRVGAMVLLGVEEATLQASGAKKLGFSLHGGDKHKGTGPRRTRLGNSVLPCRLAPSALFLLVFKLFSFSEN